MKQEIIPITPQELTKVYEGYYKGVRARCGRIAGWGEGDDLAQEAFLEAWKNREKIRNVKNCLLTIAHNHSINFIRFKGNGKKLDIWEYRNTLPSAEPSVLQKLISTYEDGERMIRLANAIAELSDTERLLLAEKFWRGKRLGKIAKGMGIHQSNVTRRLERILAKMRKLMGVQDGGTR